MNWLRRKIKLCKQTGNIVVNFEGVPDKEFACVLHKGHGGPWHEDKFGNRWSV